MNKSIPTFEFVEEPQFQTTMSREETAKWLRSYRCRTNGNKNRYSVMLERPGVYLVTLRYPSAPTAILNTRT